MNKQTIIETIEKMPDNVQVDEVIERILFVQSIDDAISDMDAGNVVEQGEIDNMLQEWKKESLGRGGQNRI
jgi:ABC-type antimicrobial peptide transport system ATPase subunit